MTLNQQRAAPNEDALKERHSLKGHAAPQAQLARDAERDAAPEARARASPCEGGPDAVLAHLQSAIDCGLAADRGAVARKIGLTPARVTQLLNLVMLAPDLQQAVPALEAVDGAEPMSKRALRAVAHAGSWLKQRERSTLGRGRGTSVQEDA